MTGQERDLARQLRIAAHNRRTLEAIGKARVSRNGYIQFALLGIALIVAGLALTMVVVMR